MTPSKPSSEELDKVLADLFYGGVHKSLSQLASKDKYIQTAKAVLRQYIDKEILKGRRQLALTIRQQLGTALSDYGELTPPNPKDIIKAVIEVLDRDFLTSNGAKDE